MDFSKLSESLKGNTNAAGAHMMKLGSKLKGLAEDAASNISNANLGEKTKNLAFKSAEALNSGAHKAADVIDQKGSLLGHQMRAMAETTHAKAQDTIAKIHKEAPFIKSAIHAHALDMQTKARNIGDKAKETYAKAVPILKHAQGQGAAIVGVITGSTKRAETSRQVAAKTDFRQSEKRNSTSDGSGVGVLKGAFDRIQHQGNRDVNATVAKLASKATANRPGAANVRRDNGQAGPSSHISNRRSGK